MPADERLDFIALREPRIGILKGSERGYFQQFTETHDRTHRQREKTIRRRINSVRRAKIGMAIIDRAALWRLSTVVQKRGRQFKLQIQYGFEQTDFNFAA